MYPLEILSNGTCSGYSIPLETLSNGNLQRVSYIFLSVFQSVYMCVHERCKHDKERQDSLDFKTMYHIYSSIGSSS